jgi:endonuclease/exonuclease/phosphatase family metal-dependent hydrolase
MALAASLAACSPSRNYVDPRGPRYAGSFAHAPAVGLRVVTFNLRFAREIDRTEELFRKNDHLRNASVIALQEMDAPGTEKLARALGYDYVYYPSALHPQTSRDFGNAVLSRWPIVGDHKLLLPHLSGLRRMLRTVAVADLRLPDGLLRVYSVHLATPVELTPQARVEQALAIAEDARAFPGAVVVAGDFNNRDLVSRVFDNAGFVWLSRDLGRTLRFFCWDHLFARGLVSALPSERGIVVDNNGASDHLPVWVELPVRWKGAADAGGRGPGAEGGGT